MERDEIDAAICVLEEMANNEDCTERNSIEIVLDELEKL